ncbi:hypothetical protein HDK77DRAFT_25904 [Phyllosticta capitalensis]
MIQHDGRKKRKREPSRCPLTDVPDSTLCACAYTRPPKLPTCRCSPLSSQSPMTMDGGYGERDEASRHTRPFSRALRRPSPTKCQAVCIRAMEPWHNFRRAQAKGRQVAHDEDGTAAPTLSPLSGPARRAGPPPSAGWPLGEQPTSCQRRRHAGEQQVKRLRQRSPRLGIAPSRAMSSVVPRWMPYRQTGGAVRWCKRLKHPMRHPCPDCFWCSRIVWKQGDHLCRTHGQTASHRQERERKKLQTSGAAQYDLQDAAKKANGREGANREKKIPVSHRGTAGKLSIHMPLACHTADGRR